MPHEDSVVAFAGVPHPGVHAGWSPVEARHLDDISVTVEAPAMEGTNDAVAAHPASDAEVGAEVRTMCVEDPDGAVLPSEGDEVSAQVMQGLDFTSADIVRSSDTEPAVGNGRERVPGVAHDPLSFPDMNRPANVRKGRSALVMQPQGSLGGCYRKYRGIVDGVPRVEMHLEWQMTPHTSPHWDIQGCYITTIKGDPCIYSKHMIFPKPGTDFSSPEAFASVGMTVTGMPALNAVRAVVEAPPGCITSADLPLRTFAGRFMSSKGS